MCTNIFFPMKNVHKTNKCEYLEQVGLSLRATKILGPAHLQPSHLFMPKLRIIAGESCRISSGSHTAQEPLLATKIPRSIVHLTCSVSSMEIIVPKLPREIPSTAVSAFQHHPSTRSWLNKCLVPGSAQLWVSLLLFTKVGEE